ncbi:unnamed protein product [Cylicocyclus nassatus]|uniref:Amino acid transporter transmembrane domain-containing protein n=1 Tax=Cylicocyclus nassatus TaxID=53992 RepID=A0AA36HDF6_CYLNA|nr:unnamed protein product [Cylicocyclus nassatus]
MAKEPLRERKVSGSYIIGLEYCFRFSIVFLVLGLAWAIPNLEQIIPLVGVTSGMLLALVLPSLIETEFLRSKVATRARSMRFDGIDNVDDPVEEMRSNAITTRLQGDIIRAQLSQLTRTIEIKEQSAIRENLPKFGVEKCTKSWKIVEQYLFIEKDVRASKHKEDGGLWSPSTRQKKLIEENINVVDIEKIHVVDDSTYYCL